PSLSHSCTAAYIHLYASAADRYLHSFPTRRSSDLLRLVEDPLEGELARGVVAVGQKDDRLAPFDPPQPAERGVKRVVQGGARRRSEEHTSELQSLRHLVCRLLLEKKKNQHL